MSTDITFKDMLGEPQRKCMRVGCKNFSAYTVGARVWAIGHSRTQHAPAELDSNLTICTEHTDVKLEDIFPPESRPNVDKIFKDLGRAAPGWNTAELVIRPIKRGK